MPPTERKFERTRISVEVRFWSDGAPILARTRDISLGGAFIETAHPLRVGASCLVELSAVSGATVIQIQATVRWTTVDGMGVQWGTLRTQHARAIHALLGL